MDWRVVVLGGLAGIGVVATLIGFCRFDTVAYRVHVCGAVGFCVVTAVTGICIIYSPDWWYMLAACIYWVNAVWVLPTNAQLWRSCEEDSEK